MSEYPKEKDLRATFKYCCPICLRYFNTILVSNCCQNYVCRMCIGDMAKRAKRNKGFVIRCSHCFESDFRLADVNPSDEVKYYTDTPFKQSRHTPGSNYKLLSHEKLTPGNAISPIKFNGQDENTNFKSGMGESSNGKMMHTPIKIHNIDDLALSFPSILEDNYANSRSPLALYHGINQ